jgi:hypothetical protein
MPEKWIYDTVEFTDKRSSPAHRYFDIRHKGSNDDKEIQVSVQYPLYTSVSIDTMIEHLTLYKQELIESEVTYQYDSYSCCEHDSGKYIVQGWRPPTDRELQRIEKYWNAAAKNKAAIKQQ